MSPIPTIESDPSPIAPRRPLWRRALTWLPALIALIHPAAVLAARWDWRADLLTHFQVPALGATALALAVLIRQRRRAAAALAVLAVCQAWPLIQFYGPNPVPADPNATGRLRILMANVLSSNDDHERIARLIRREQPDVAGLVEVTHNWLADLEMARRDYPYHFELPAGGRGLALWLRKKPLDPVLLDVPSPDGWPFLQVTIDLGGLPCRLWLVHPANPFLRRGLNLGITELDALAERIARAGGSRIVVGDMNTTDGSPYFGDFLRISGLRDSRLGFGIQPSWPTWSPLRIPIDHGFVSDDLAVIDRRLGPDIGSDHRPLILEVGPARADNPATQASQSSDSASP